MSHNKTHTPTSNHSHSLAGTPLSGAETVIQVMADEGVDTIFGYSGGAILPVYDALFRYNEASQKQKQETIQLVVPANEQGAGFMASGYARSTGKVGVLLVTSGPGATNAITPVRDCMADSIPMVMICGQVPVASMGTDAFQEAPILNSLSPCAKHVFLIKDPAQLEKTLRAAFEIARSGRPGPVVIDLPKDVQNAIQLFAGEGSLPIRGYRQRLEAIKTREISDEQCQAFFDLMEKSERPLIMAGGGVIISKAAAELKEFAERYQIPVANTLNGLGGFDTTSPLAMRMVGMHGTIYANYAIDDCDLLIAIGARFDDRVAGRPADFAPNVKAIIHIDIDQSEIGKIKTPTWSFVGEAKQSLRRLLDYGKDFTKKYAEWADYAAEMRKNYPMDFDRQSDRIQPQYVLEELNKLIAGNAIVVTGVGQHQIWACQHLDFVHPRQWLTSGAMATMGFGLPAAIGAQVAHPDQLVVNIDGDGSLRMNIGEMETAVNYNLPIKVLLFNNSGDGMVRQWQRLFFDGRLSGSEKHFHRKDFVKAAEADGYKYSRRVDQKSNVTAALDEFIKFDGPAFLEIIIDPDAHVFPMVAPGQTYDQMDTGPFMKSRPKKEAEKHEYNPLNMPDSF